MEVYEVWDERLHRTIAEAANNLVLTSIFEGLNAIRKKIVWGHMKKAILRPQRRQFYSAHHKKIVAAIIDRDADSARRAMAEHLQQVEAIYLRIERAGLGSNNPIGL
jgi:DNA-binding FadR family transcriptional regulator